MSVLPAQIQMGTAYIRTQERNSARITLVVIAIVPLLGLPLSLGAGAGAGAGIGAGAAAAAVGPRKPLASSC